MKGAKMLTRNKEVEELTVNELHDEIQDLDYYLQSCAEIGQGWSTKDVVRRTRLIEELDKR
jgi:hypothetical protein